jgi:pyridoxine 4-dehydrogenase
VNSPTLTFAGRTVHRLGYGAMRIVGPGVWGEPADHDEAIAVLRRAVELGVDLIDTADSYGPEVSERLIREALHPYGDVLIATKAGYLRTGPDQWIECGLTAYLRQQCELSLRRLGVEALDLFQLHRVDSKVPADEQFGLLAELLAEGKVKAVGLSEVSVAQLEAARAVVPIASVQNLFNLTHRKSEDVLERCEEIGVAFLPWFPVAAGRLARPGGPLDERARDLGVSVAQLSIAWLLACSPVMVPIPGTSKVAHLEENCAAAHLELAPEVVAELSALA